jgi:hypothetical protein
MVDYRSAFQALPSTVRRIVYLAFALVSLIAGGLQVGYSAAELGQPVWLTVTLAVLAYVGIAVGFLAAGNTPAPERTDS